MQMRRSWRKLLYRTGRLYRCQVSFVMRWTIPTIGLCLSLLYPMTLYRCQIACRWLAEFIGVNDWGRCQVPASFNTVGERQNRRTSAQLRRSFVSIALATASRHSLMCWLYLCSCSCAVFINMWSHVVVLMCSLDTGKIYTVLRVQDVVFFLGGVEFRVVHGSTPDWGIGLGRLC